MTFPGTEDEYARCAATLAVLSALVQRPPTAEMLSGMRQAEWLTGWPMERTSVCRAGLDLLASSAVEGEDADAIAADFARLVGGPGRVVVHPYESVHRSVEGLLFDEQTLEVRAAYAEFGLAAPRQNREPDDHLGLELEFLATLATLWLDSPNPAERERVARAFERFCREHVFRWAPQFFNALGHGAQTRFYHGVALLGVDSLVQLGAGEGY